jgi:hypothetical protein
MRIRNKKANKKIVDEGVMAPIKWVIHFKRSNHIVKTRMTDPVRSHNQEYSSRSLLLLTSSMMSNNIPIPTTRATILFRIGMNAGMVSSFCKNTLSVSRVRNQILRCGTLKGFKDSGVQVNDEKLEIHLGKETLEPLNP